MNDNAKKWVEALRSGKYRQGKGRLRTGDKFCCLGVACELAIEAGIIGNPEEIGHNIYRYNGESQVLPDVVKDWLGLAGNNGDFARSVSSEGSLAMLNDQGKTFENIADIIECQPKGLFVE